MPGDGSSANLYGNLDGAARPVHTNLRMLLGGATTFMPCDNLGIAVGRTHGLAD
jgi:hypothetical protein